MQITIWDLDYYYSKTKVNCFNVDAMKISSFHRQKGDSVNFVQTEFDIHRPYDIYYIIKEKEKTPNPPIEFFTDRKVRWWGDAFRVRVNWRPSAAMLGCAPDYLLYPEKNTTLERAEYIRLFDNRGKLLPITQNYRNSFKNKITIDTDFYFWESDKKSILIALDMLKDVKNVSFLNPIRLDLLLCDKDIKEAFLQLKLTRKSVITFSDITFSLVDEVIDFILLLQEKNKNVSINSVFLTYDANAHWDNRENALKDFEEIKKALVKGHQTGVNIKLKPMRRLESPYFYLFEQISNWSCMQEHISWFQYLLRQYPYCDIGRPATWHEVFRDLIRQTYTDKEFFLTIWKNKKQSENEVPWKILEKEFENGL